MSLQVWLPLNKDPNVIPAISSFYKESYVTLAEDSDGWYKVSDSYHKGSRWGIYYNFEVKPNTTYTLMVYSKSTTGVSTSIGIQSFNTTPGWPSVRDTNATSTEKLTTYTWTTGENHTTARIYLAINPSTTIDNNYVFFKEPVVWETPRNQGLSNVTVTNNGAVFNSAGKLGGCYSFGTEASALSLPKSFFTSFSGDFSIACWVKIIAWNSSYATIWAATSTSASWSNIMAGLFRNGSSSKILFCIGNDSSSTGSNCITTEDIQLNTWYHFVCTYTPGKICLYQNGNLVSSWNTSIVPKFSATQYFNIGKMRDGTYQTNSSINDFRIYDHCLSPMEVKRLSQGLVLHYPLNRQGWGQDNLLINTHFDSRYNQTTGWDTNKNGTLLANSWNGYNGGVTNSSTCYHAHLKIINGEYIYEYIRDTETWLGISQGGLQSKLSAGKTYTISWEQYCVSGVNYVAAGLYYYKTGATSANFHSGLGYGNTNRVLGVWQKFSYTFTMPSDADYSKNMSMYFYGHYGGTGTLYLRHLKFEEGDTSTPWCPNSADTLYSTMGLDSTIEYDCSGFCNNGTRTGTFSWTSDTPKYNVSTKFNGSECILRDSPGADIYTLTCWAKTSKSKSTAQFMVADSNSKLSISFYNGNIISYFYGNSAGTGSKCILGTEYKENEWNFFAVVKTGENTRDCYCNGVKLTPTSNDWWSTATGFFVGNRSSGGNGPFYGEICDVRAYATVLSADDIKYLYESNKL